MLIFCWFTNGIYILAAEAANSFSTGMSAPIFQELLRRADKYFNLKHLQRSMRKVFNNFRSVAPNESFHFQNFNLLLVSSSISNSFSGRTAKRNYFAGMFESGT